MPHSLVLGNGNFLVTLDRHGLVHDLYYPYVGMENHSAYTHYHRIGVYDETARVFSWLTDEHWQTESHYRGESLVGETTLRSDVLQLELQFSDFVHPTEDIFCRSLRVKNLKKEHRNIRIFFNIDFHLYGVKENDTAVYSPKNNTVIFYKYNRYFLINGQTHNGGINQFTVGKAEFRDLEGTWRDAEDGELSGHSIEQGSVDATVGFHLAFDDQELCSYWICAGKNFEEVEASNQRVFVMGVPHLLDFTQQYWNAWVNKQDFTFTGVSDPMIALFKQSMLVIRTQTDNRGAIIAANDSDIMKFNKDTYSYMWPRDGALVAMALDNTGYGEITKRFFRFCARILTNEGYLLHKYNPDGSLGSSWHPWIYEGEYQVPLQEDETALPLIALKNHYDLNHDIEFIQSMYEKFILPSANFLCVYRDDATGLPLPSYDLWEEQKGVFTFTGATVYQGLRAAGDLAAIVGHPEHADRYHMVAEQIKTALLKYLYCEECQSFLKKVVCKKNGEIINDHQADASICGVFLFGLLPADDPRVVFTMHRLKKLLWVPTEIGGMARYEQDMYQRTEQYPTNIPGNPWIITTLWYAQWLLKVAKTIDSPELTEAESILRWVVKHAVSGGILAEQLHPFTGQHLSVAPLTWSHATYIDTIMLYRSRLDDFGICEDCKIEKYL